MIFGGMGKRKERHKQDNENLLRSLHAREVKYVSRREPGTYGETIIGRNGKINIVENELIIICSGDIVFRQSLENLSASELLSLDGVNLKYADEQSGEVSTIVAYYKYHRK